MLACRRVWMGCVAFGAVAIAVSCSDGTTGPSKSVTPTIPVSPDIAQLPSQVVNGAREFRVTASVFQQQLATFPFRMAEVWGYNGSTPGPTAIAYEGEKIRFVVTNSLPEPTTVHFHGMHQPNEDDGVAGVSQLDLIQPGHTYTYEFTPGHPGFFAYHSHTSSAKQELKGLDGMFVILPKSEKVTEHVDRDYLFTLQSFFLMGEGQPVVVFPPGGGFNFHTMNGKTRDATSELPAKVGETIRLRFYNASQLDHSMHLHGFDMTIVSQNGHERPEAGRYAVTTVDEGPGNFFEVIFKPDKPGKWLFHCHFPHHTSNAMMDGPDGSPVGMARVFNVTQ
jgi:FtsP/CotA-like multicopper oxidase with cupredoxin domain